MAEDGLSLGELARLLGDGRRRRWGRSVLECAPDVWLAVLAVVPRGGLGVGLPGWLVGVEVVVRADVRPGWFCVTTHDGCRWDPVSGFDHSGCRVRWAGFWGAVR